MTRVIQDKRKKSYITKKRTLLFSLLNSYIQYTLDSGQFKMVTTCSQPHSTW